MGSFRHTTALTDKFTSSVVNSVDSFKVEMTAEIKSDVTEEVVMGS